MKNLDLSRNRTNSKGITLVALVISIIVLLILATVTIQTLTGNNGLLTKAETAVQSNNDSQELEKIKLAVAAAQLAGQGSITTDNLNGELRENFGDNSINLDEKSGGWILSRNKEYTIYENGKVEEGNLLPLLPKEYQQVEYIESTGTQYIDTEYYSCNNEEIELKVLFNGRTGDFSFMGGMENSSTTFWDFWYVDGYGELQYYAARNSSPRRTSLDPVIKKNTEYVLKSVLNNNIYTAYYNGVSLGSIDEISNNVSPNSLWLFADFSGRYNKMQGKIYYCKILSNNKLIKNFIPCYRISDNVVGMFDTVQGKFYVNKGTGTFFKGNDV